MTALVVALFTACTPVADTPQAPVVAVSVDMHDHCAEVIGAPQVHDLGDGIFVATGYDLANITVIQTDVGRIVIDPLMSPTRSTEARVALDAFTSGPIRAVIYTHSHIDHVGGASVWVEPDTEVWATEAFVPSFFGQYGRYLPAESGRGARQFGHRVPIEALPCSSLGRRIDLTTTLEQGFVLPTHTFSGRGVVSVGNRTLELVEAHGETTDQLFVWWPQGKVLWPGDNWYRAFPNLYTIRGTKPRPVDAWIDSLDRMRSLQPERLVPSHTQPLVGAQAIENELRDYRDAIQFVRDASVRGANAGADPQQLASEVRLPAHLAANPSLAELYGQVDWSVRAIISNEIGWFSGKAWELYPLPPADVALRSVAQMGGEQAVRQAADDSDDPRWTAHLLALLDHTGADVDAELAEVYATLAAQTDNTNGRAYLLQSSVERSDQVRSIGRPVLSEGFVAGLSMEQLFSLMQTRLKPQEALGVHEALQILFPDIGRSVWLTVRRGVLEVVWDVPLVGTPEPVGTVSVASTVWRDLALERRGTAGALAAGDIGVQGDATAVVRFLGRFEQGTLTTATSKP